MKKRFSKNLAGIIVASLVMGVVSLPDSVKDNLPVGAWAKAQKTVLGLDLQGGTQLDYRIDLSAVEAKNSDDDPTNDVREVDIIEGVRTTIERRVNSLGVSEPSIFLSNIADEKHIIVELAGIKDVDEAKATVGKTIQLEFKERRAEGETDEGAQQIEAEAQKILREVTAYGADFEEIGKRVRRGDGKIDYSSGNGFEPNLPGEYGEILPSMKEGAVHPRLIERTAGFAIDSTGNIVEEKGKYLVQLVSKEDRERTIEKTEDFFEASVALNSAGAEKLAARTRADFEPEVADAIFGIEVNETTDILEVGDNLEAYQVTWKSEEAEEKVSASHILVAYEGATRASSDVTRSKKEAKKRALEILEEVNADPENFAAIATENSDGPSATKGGDLGEFGRGVMTPAFEKAAFSMEEGDVSELVETEFGYHIIKLDAQLTEEDQITVIRMRIANTEENRVALEEALATTQPHEVTETLPYYTFNEIFFNTLPDQWKATGLDGSNFKFATVSYDQIGNPLVSIEFDSEGADKFEALTERLQGQQMAIFVGGQLISAPNVQQKITGGSAVITGSYGLQEALQLANDLNTGAIDAPILLTGQYTISATLGENALSLSLYAGIIGLLLLAIYMIAYYRIFGVLAVVALAIYTIAIVFIIKVTGIVMTLAGIAGIILSIGMAVDANILIFERTLEELNSGKTFGHAVNNGFARAWSSIRDSNVSSLITCAILWFFGNSIIRGFALMLAIGIVLSMFTAINVTREFIKTLDGTKVAKSKFMLGAKKVVQ